MKKFFNRFGQKVSKYRKRLIYGTLALFIGQICFFNFGGIGIQNEVFAQSSTQQDNVTTKQAEKRNSTFSFFNKAVYILIYPMMVLAGKLADNSFVYGEIFGFDAVLWHLWNIIKNLANFTLGFFFIYKIFRYLINKQENVKDIVLKALIAGIGIQASRFLMATLIDASTILTYGIGGLPISVLKDSDNDEDFNSKYNPYILKNVIDVDVANLDSTNSTKFYLTNTEVGENKEGSFYISECSTFTYGVTGNNEDLILAPKMIYYKDNSGNYIPTDSNRCHLYGQIYYFNSLYSGNSYNLQQFVGKDKFVVKNTDRTGTQDNYKKEIDNITLAIKPVITGNTTIISLIEQGTVLEIGDAHTTGGTIGNLWTGVYKSDQKRGLDVDSKRTGSGGNTSKLQDILNGNSYVGVFTSLYSNLLNLRTGVITTNNGGLFPNVLNSALALGYVLAIGIPLIIVAVVFMIRIGVIWMAIALSPFIVLGSSFKKEIGDNIFKGKFREYFNLKNLIPIIFSPAIICFAISMSAVLVNIISRFNTAEIATESQKILGGLIEMNIGSGTIPLAKLIIAVFGVAITRFLVWAAIETSKIGESGIVKSLKDLTTTALGNIPIVPVPGKNRQGVEWIGANSAFGLNGNQGILSQATNNLKTQFEGENNKALDARLDPNGVKERARNSAKTSRVTQYISSLTSQTINDNWATSSITPNDILGADNVNTTFANLESDADAQKVIDAINGLGKDKLLNITDGHTVTAHGKTRVFKQKDSNGNDSYKYEEQQPNPNNPASSSGSSTSTTT